MTPTVAKKTQRVQHGTTRLAHAAPPPPREEALYRRVGRLVKQRGGHFRLTHPWVSRWFAVTNDGSRLLHFTDASLSRVHTWLDLRDAHVRDATPSERVGAPSAHVFVASTAEKRWKLCAATAREADAWRASLSAKAAPTRDETAAAQTDQIQSRQHATAPAAPVMTTTTKKKTAAAAPEPKPRNREDAFSDDDDSARKKMRASAAGFKTDEKDTPLAKGRHKGVVAVAVVNVAAAIALLAQSLGPECEK